MPHTTEQALKEIIDTYGRDILDDPACIRALLKDMAPKSIALNNLLVILLQLKIHKLLLKGQQPEELVKLVCLHYPFDKDIVSYWITEVLSKKSHSKTYQKIIKGTVEIRFTTKGYEYVVLKAEGENHLHRESTYFLLDLDPAKFKSGQKWQFEIKVQVIEGEKFPYITTISGKQIK